MAISHGPTAGTGFLWDERYAWHDTGAGALYLPAGGYVEPDIHVENPSPKRRFRNLVEVSGLIRSLSLLEARPATKEELLRLHTGAYVDRVKELSDDSGGDAGDGTLFGPGGFEIAALAAGGCLVAVDAVLEGRVQNAYALVRPPGHHARAGSGGGFCIFGNVALAALHAHRAHGLERVAIVDWDVHHGNGTQEAFWEDPSVLTISVHQDNAYPSDSGRVKEVGAGAGTGFNINVPLPPGSGAGAYQAVMERVVVPALASFRPELVPSVSTSDETPARA